MRKFGVGIVGLGLALKPHALALRDLAGKVEVIGGFSPSAARRADFAATWQWPAVESFRALCDDPRIDALLILTPPRTHTELAIAVAKAGKHVLLEKPVAVDLAEATALVDAVEYCNRALAIMFQHRFRPGARALRELLRSHALGDLFSVSTSIRWWRSPEYFAQAGARHEGTRCRRRPADPGDPHAGPAARSGRSGPAGHGVVPDQSAARDRHRGHRLCNGYLRQRRGRRDRRDHHRLPRLSGAHRDRGNAGAAKCSRPSAWSCGLQAGLRSSWKVPARAAAAPTRWRFRTSLTAV